MKNANCFLYCLVACVFVVTVIGCMYSRKPVVSANNFFLLRATQTLDSLYTHYAADGTCLLRENYPFHTAEYAVTYFASEVPENTGNQFSYLWPYSGTFSAVAALLEATREPRYKKMLDSRVLPGLQEYYDDSRSPEAYASYINAAPVSDRFYDDNVWLGIDFTDIYRLTKEKKYLEQAQLIWRFVESGMDSRLGGGIYWCEQKKLSKNTCSNAPGSVLALKLFSVTGDSAYFEKGRRLYEWTQHTLQDTTDFLYFDNISVDGKISKAKYAYNSGQMMQSAALLYKLTEKQDYLKDAQRIAQSCHRYFFSDYEPVQGNSFSLLKKGDVWFSAVMLRGFIELYEIDGNKQYLDSFTQSLDYAWEHARDTDGLFNTDFSGEKKDERKWLLTQAAMIEMYARLAAIQ